MRPGTGLRPADRRVCDRQVGGLHEYRSTSKRADTGETTVNIKRFASAAAIAGAIGAAGLGLGAGSAQADDGWVPWVPWDPGHGVGDWGHGPDWGPPGQVKKECEAPFWTCGTPPGHWVDGP